MCYRSFDCGKATEEFPTGKTRIYEIIEKSPKNTRGISQYKYGNK
jgi:hypothetical protein